MHTFLFAAGLLLTALYVVFVLSLYVGLRRLKPGTNSTRNKVSVVVAARNEETQIRACIDALLLQDYPQDLLEIIVVNDRSEDKTLSILEEYTEHNPSIKIINISEIPAGFAPKKYALTKGVEAAEGEIICSTDADCVPPPAWVSEMVSYFDDETGFVAGFSPLYALSNGSADFDEPAASGKHKTSKIKLPDIKKSNGMEKSGDSKPSFFESWHLPAATWFRVFRGHFERIIPDFLFMDSIGLATASAGGIGLGTPWTCAGRNLAYRKSAFDEIGGYEDVKSVISGDDDLLMLGISKKTNWKLRFALGEKSAVPSYDDNDLNGFANQRTRHSSKFFVHPPRLKIASAAIFLFYCACIFYPVYMLISWQFLAVFPVMAGSKFIVELFATSKGAKLFGAQFRFSSFLKTYFIHPFVTVLFGILGSRGKITWKDSEFSKIK